MKIYFNMEKYQNHVFSKKSPETIFVFDLINGWVAKKTRCVEPEIKFGAVHNIYGEELETHYHDAWFNSNVILRLNYNNPMHSWWLTKAVVECKIQHTEYCIYS